MAGCGNGGVIGSGPLPTPTPVIPSVTNEFAAAANSQPTGITVGPDGFLYFTERGQANGKAQIGKISTGGSLTEIAVTPATAQPIGIIKGPDNLLWFTESGADSIVSMSTASGNTMTAYPLGTPPGGAASWQPAFIAVGPGNNTMFFTAPGANAIGEITTSGTIAGSVVIPTAASNPLGIVTGPDLNIWFAENAASKIGRLNSSNGTITEFPTPTANAGPTSIVIGPDGALWFTENTAAKLGRITTTGIITEYPLTNAGSASGLVVGADANFFFGDPVKNQFGQAAISAAFTNTMFPIKTSNAGPSVMVLGPDNRIYFTETNAAKIGQISYF
jgi:streptogramin lyase